MIYPELSNVIKSYLGNFDQIPGERKKVLEKLAAFVHGKMKHGNRTDLIFICTHNSRRSHLSQVWAQTAAEFYNVKNVDTYSGGTEVTALNPRVVKALTSVGYRIERLNENANPVYEVRYSDDVEPMRLFSKTYDDETNPKEKFGAVMTCARADQNCPMVTGAETRIAITYEDPGAADNTLNEATAYAESVRQIGEEMLYAFSLINERHVNS